MVCFLLWFIISITVSKGQFILWEPGVPGATETHLQGSCIWTFASARLQQLLLVPTRDMGKRFVHMQLKFVGIVYLRIIFCLFYSIFDFDMNDFIIVNEIPGLGGQFNVPLDVFL